ncbi:STAS domain-containing protein [Streptacidiphilus sp. N1-12]|uniref:STAS domain-containing protein n=2 Tax=Streptacidiphilus alkalitolerans TaxID=3342712 RepID=A0ABV6VBC6_9ACTN
MTLRQRRGHVRTGEPDGRGGRTVVELYGEIDIATTWLLTRHLDAATAGDRPQVVVDLRGVSFIDSGGMGPLCRAWCRAQDRGGDMSLICTDSRILKTLRLAGLTPTISVATPRRAVRLGRRGAVGPRVREHGGK